MGAISAGMFNAVGATFGDGIKAGSAKHLQKILAHGVVGGMASRATGGKFSDGFRSAAAAQAFAPMIDGIGGEYGSDQWAQSGARAQRIAVAAIVGGSTAAMTGGKFANGAVTAAFSRAFNDEATVNRRMRITRTAEELLQEGGYAYTDKVDNFPSQSYKCGKFVYDVLEKSGIDAPTLPGGEWPYRPEQWGNPNLKISGWQIVDTPMNGDVVAQVRPYSDASGHVGVVVDGANQKTISAGTLGVKVDNFGFQSDPRYSSPIIFRRYIGP